MLFIALQHGGLFERSMRMLNHVAAGRFEGAIGHSARIDRAIQTLYRRRGAIARCLIWQLVGWIAGAAEVGAALWFLGKPLGIIEALIIESIIQAVSSAAFMIPGALGVQEAAFLLVGGALGLDQTAALALAGARRIRDCVIFMPGLLSWQIAESNMAAKPGA
jgi:putative membrane protein